MDRDFDFNVLAAKVGRWKDEGSTVALCHGCFDPLHVGHVEHFAEAASCADKLIVTVTPDRFVRKGPGRPAFSERDRARVVGAIRLVDAVAINPWPDAVQTLEILRPHLFVKGSDYAGNRTDTRFSAEQATAEQLGVVVRVTTTAKHSSTDLLRRLRGEDKS